ncbi:pyridoxamine 5'-phosphate oxidase family protein [Microbispora corallina]|uniref:Oxidoreductase n=1 Tax=Microbispora corallina TaxID=83302 RepID=A0ABQ4G4L1_9ACTN|nr:pyridoxamine 5'-phosphate oxidase family protein [Microbispora corallina]GIH42001.1 oxidoreductase [Microbispora corallina]
MRHPGELAVQARAGVRLGDHGSAGVRADIPGVAADFVAAQPMLVAGAADQDGRVWAGLLTGAPGFARATGPRELVVDAVPAEPLDGLFEDERDIGLLAIDPATRRRMRVNGRAWRHGGRLLVRTEQVYSNCPKYLQQREIAGPPGPAERTARAGDALTDAQRAWVEGADTFFVATFAEGLGADVSHRGGAPGFVETTGGRRLVWPDYVGNSMYMTLGNLELNPAAGLLFLDWETGDALHVTGRARVGWDPRDVPGAQRLVEFDVDEVLHVTGTGAPRWAFVAPSRFNPPVRSAPR